MPNWRRWRDLNPRVAMNDLSVFKTDLFDHLSTPPSKNYEIVWKMRFRQSFRQSAKKHSNPFLRGKKVKRDKGFQKSSSELTTLFSKDRLVVTASIPLRIVKNAQPFSLGPPNGFALPHSDADSKYVSEIFTEIMPATCGLPACGTAFDLPFQYSKRGAVCQDSRGHKNRKPRRAAAFGRKSIR